MSQNNINSNNDNKTTIAVTSSCNTLANVTKGISWSKIAAQNNNTAVQQLSSCSSIPTTPLSKDIVTMISPIMKPTPSSTPLSSSSSSSLLSSSSNNVNNGSNKSNNFQQANNLLFSNLSTNVTASTATGNLTTENQTNYNCALCKNILNDKKLPNKAYFRVALCKHSFHKEVCTTRKF